jgi:ABC-type transporter MlaC component
MEAIGKLSKEYLEREYHQAILDFKGAINEDARW